MENQNQRVRVFCRLKPVTNEHQGAHELEILNLHHILKLAHISIPMKGQKFDANNNVIEKGANNDSNTTDDEASTASESVIGRQ